jgi:hypothetical protein
MLGSQRRTADFLGGGCSCQKQINEAAGAARIVAMSNESLSLVARGSGKGISALDSRLWITGHEAIKRTAKQLQFSCDCCEFGSPLLRCYSIKPEPMRPYKTTTDKRQTQATNHI